MYGLSTFSQSFGQFALSEMALFHDYPDEVESSLGISTRYYFTAALIFTLAIGFSPPTIVFFSFVFVHKKSVELYVPGDDGSGKPVAQEQLHTVS